MTYGVKIINGEVILEHESVTMEVAIKDGIIVALGYDLGNALRVVDASGLIVSPGMVDAHVHISDPVDLTVLIGKAMRVVPVPVLRLVLPALWRCP